MCGECTMILLFFHYVLTTRDLLEYSVWHGVISDKKDCNWVIHKPMVSLTSPTQSHKTQVAHDPAHHDHGIHEIAQHRWHHIYYLLILFTYFQLTWILRNRRKSYPHVQPIHHNQSNRAQSSYLIKYEVHHGSCQNLGGKSSDLILSHEVKGGPTPHETLIDHWIKYGRIISIAPFIKYIEPTSSQ